jgi:hypothetical protein
MDKKFIESYDVGDYEIFTDDGYKDLLALNKTIPYQVYKLVTERLELKCADNHIVFLSDDSEIFIKNLVIGDKIKTKNGLEEVISVDDMGYTENMWDFELSGDYYKYYTNFILSHNTTYIRKIIHDLSEEKTIIYVPSYMMYSIAEPELISFVSKFKNSILLLEDAESILTNSTEDRDQAVTNILNISDGLLNDYMDMQIIATLNVQKSVIDEALLRKGRLMVNYKFKKLTATQATKLSKYIKTDKKYTEPQTLAEVYEEKNGKQLIDLVDVDEPSGMGFKIKK